MAATAFVLTHSAKKVATAKSRFIVAMSSVLLSASFPASVRAQATLPGSSAQLPAAESDVWQHTLDATAQVGFGMPLGNLGAELEYCPLSWMSVDGGVGISTISGGIQAALGARARLLHGNVTAFGVEGAASIGNSDLTDPSLAHPESRKTYRYRPGYFINGGVFLEHRWSRWLLREHLGLARALNGNPDSECSEGSPCEPVASTSRAVKSTPYVGIAFGYFFF
jgi:hypothetical protein